VVESRFGLYGTTKVQAGRPGPVDWLVARMDFTWLGLHRHSKLGDQCRVAVTAQAVMETTIKTSYMKSRVYGKTVALRPFFLIATDS
jgi:hypothetical protein